MIFDPKTYSLYADDGEFLKTIHCPMAVGSQILNEALQNSPDRYCSQCDQTIRNADGMTDEDIRAALDDNADVCVFATPKASHIVMLKPRVYGTTVKNFEDLLSIRTARNLEAMNGGVKQGFRPLVLKAGPTSDVGESCCLFQHRESGRVVATGHSLEYPCHQALAALEEELLTEDRAADEILREISALRGEWTEIARFHYRPDWQFPFAAYLMPRNLKPGQRVFLEDLIQDVPAAHGGPSGAQGRLLSSQATWTGSCFELDRLTISFEG